MTFKKIIQIKNANHLIRKVSPPFNLANILLWYVVCPEKCFILFNNVCFNYNNFPDGTKFYKVIKFSKSTLSQKK